jgi:hypothetical protein
MLRFCLAALAALRVFGKHARMHPWKSLPSASRSPCSNANAHGLPSTLATGSFGPSSVASGHAGPMSFNNPVVIGIQGKAQMETIYAQMG